MWTLRGVQIQPLAIVAPDTFGLDDSLPADCTPLTCLFTNLTGATFRPAFNPKDRQLRQQPEHGANRTEKATVQVSYEHGGDQQHS